MKKLLIALIAVLFFIGMVQADDEPVEPEVIEEVIEEVLEEPTAEPTEEVIKEVIIEEPVIEELVQPEEEILPEEPTEEEVKYIVCSTTYLVSENSKGVAVFEHFDCVRADGNGNDGYTKMVAQFVNTSEYFDN